MTYDEYLADSASQFHDLRVSPNFDAALDPAVWLRLIHGDSGGVCLALSSAFTPDHIGK
jgi:hypothetical protein